MNLHFFVKKSFIFIFFESYSLSLCEKVMNLLIDFSVKNFGCIKDEVTLSMEATKSDELEDTYVIKQGKFRLLKLALIYGPNASGKTTILKAFEFLRDLILLPQELKTDELDFNPFLFDENTEKSSSKFSLNFLVGEKHYFYSIEFSKKLILKEELYVSNPKKSLVFLRETDPLEETTEIKFGNKIKIGSLSKKSLELNTLGNNSVLGGYLKTNINVEELKEVIDWFENFFKPVVFSRTILASFASNLIHNNKVSKNVITQILRKSDFYITDIIFKEEEVEQELVIRFPFDNSKKVKVQKDEGVENENSSKVKRKIVKTFFTHTVNEKNYPLPFQLESEGTKRYYGLAVLLVLMIENNNLFLIDELESSLHPDLITHFLITYLSNTKNTQLIVTTHYRELLGNKDLFRNDVIWFTDKKKDGSIELYSLSDFKSKELRNTNNVLNFYKSGKLGAIPQLGDNYVELE